MKVTHSQRRTELFRAIRIFLVFVFSFGGILSAQQAVAESEAPQVAPADDPQALYEKAMPLLSDPKNEEKIAEALLLLRTAAEKGYAPAENSLGYVYDNGIGVPTDRGEARKWFEKAATQGLAKAQFNYGRYLALGIGGDPDVEAGLATMEKASSQGLMPAKMALAHIYYFGEYGQKADHEKAFPLYLAAAESGDADAQNFVATMFAYGMGVKLNRSEAAKWYLMAAEQGHAKAQASIARCYLGGNGIKRDKVEAIKFYILSAKQGEVTGANPLEELMPNLDPKIIKEATKRAKQFRPKVRATEVQKS
ncbi:MAG: tetratricopeptide repeat protein [Terrimicrobiaceae bacterium]